ncbi:MAG: diaminopimelate epimerase [Corynebacterium sp.]|uniref:diaminopimelate epimerase n=1 Tax=Corynebacterium sp. TaxID=1720 RepID=UPI0026DF1790|nr:diaminopimelate epimerase [Corynebacterium sp.]MDO5669509.1 diaminopimelate epimerase [Corynebacterium sp.]
MSFAKGHGTENDFLIIDASVDPTRQQVRALCERRAGLGADGLLRAVDTGGQWFMDYRNADGSIAEMCGNGVRVFAHWLRSRGLVDTDEFIVGTRAGDRPVIVREWSDTDAQVTVEMGPAEVTGLSTARLGELHVSGLGVDMGNPHLACVLPGLTPDTLRALTLPDPDYDREFFPGGVNVEILTPLIDNAVHMRVHERGVGETRSCGTGTVAAARAALADAGRTDGTVTVHIPGGSVQVSIDGQRSTLTGPSRIIASGHTVI